jgi:hypothetical protein
VPPEPARIRCRDGPAPHLHIVSLAVAGVLLLIAIVAGGSFEALRSGRGAEGVLLLLLATTLVTLRGLRHTDWTMGGG